MQTIFQRYEIKYLMTKLQQQYILRAMAPYMELDQYGHSKICNLYFDTDHYRLIRRSLEKPVYKEKLRVRSYGRVGEEGTVFVELKKKYRHVVYKRRIALPQNQALAWLGGTYLCSKESSQIVHEINYVLSFYSGLKPLTYLSYEREAFVSEKYADFRVTFDENIVYRQNDISLCSEIYGTPILPKNVVLMEIKCIGGIPLWMTHALTQQHIYHTSFSKYGTAYQKFILPKILKG